eukprot:gene9866-13273_t
MLAGFLLSLFVCQYMVGIDCLRFGMTMKVKTPSVGNIPRKLKRNLRSLTNENFSNIYTPEFDEYLKSQASPAIYEQLLKQVNKKARSLKITVKPEFGYKAPVVRPNIVETAIAAGTFTTLVAAVQAAGLVDTLKGGLITVLAPSDEAFAKLPPGTVEGLLADIPKLQNVLKHHVLDGSSNSKKIGTLNGQTVDTLLGTKLNIKVGKQDKEVTIENAKVTAVDIKCLNGLIHVIDTVLIPPESA